MNVLILAGKGVDKQSIDVLLKDHERTLVRLVAVSRGVRRLEKQPADLVLLVPDAEDDTWKRAVIRVREEYQCQVIVLLQEDGAEAEAQELGAFDCFLFDANVADSLARSFRHLQSQAALERQLTRGRDMLEWMETNDAFGSWERDEAGQITWSKGLCRIYEENGGTLEEGVRSLRQRVHPDDLEIFDRANETTFERGWPLDFEYRILGKDDRVCHLHVRREVELDSAGRIVRAYGMARDVSLYKEFEELLFRRDAILQVLANFASKFLRKSDCDEDITNALTSLGKVTDVSRIFLFRKEGQQPAEETPSLRYEWVAEGIEPILGRPEFEGRIFETGYESWRSAMLRQKVVAGHVRNFRKEERNLFQSTGAKSVLIVPVFAGNIWLGFIGLSEHRRERDWLPVEIESIMLAANLFGSAIHYGIMNEKLIAANRSTEQASAAALEANLAKSMFLANMSHEIRTPISGILGMAELVVTTGLTDEQREHVDMIRDAARSLLNIVNDILDISKIEAGKMELKPEDYTFREALDTSLRPFETQAELSNLVFRYTVADTVPTRLNGDPERLGQILRNLIGNALKFTERGLVELTVDVLKREADRVCLIFKVRDTGVGIPEGKLDEVFDSFTQADNSLRKKHQGTGLGLTISRQLVTMMGGEIGVKSVADHGSTFHFSAWFGVVEGEESDVEVAKPKKPEGLYLNILLADDNPMNRKYLTHFLTMFGHTITTAANGLEVLDILRSGGEEIDLVLMDIQMPEMSGLEATRAIRESDGRRFDRNLPIIALTAYAMKGDRERMLDCGMNDYVSKPVDMHKLSEAIVSSMAGRIKTRHKSARNGPVSAPRSASQSALQQAKTELNMEALVRRFEGNMDLLKDILDLFLLEARQKVEDLDKGLEDGDLKATGAALHSITNISSHVLAMEMVRISRNLEKQCFTGETDAVRAGVKDLKPRFLALVKAVEVAANKL